MKKLISAALLSLLVVMSSGCSSGPSPEVLQQRQQAVAKYGTRIVPGVSIGPVRLGMGLDEVQALLGDPDGKTLNSDGADMVWYVNSLNLVISFTPTATPTVSAVTTWAYANSDMTMGQMTWADTVPVQTEFTLPSGIKLGATSYDVERAYGSYTSTAGSIVMEYDRLGLSFVVTKDHRVMDISVAPPH
jgi:hypothetical protein